MQRDTGNGETKAPLPRQEREEFAVQDNHSEDRREGKDQKTDPPHGQREDGGRQRDQSHAHTLAPLEVQVVGSFPRSENESGPWDRPAHNVRPDDGPQLPALQMSSLDLRGQENAMPGPPKADP